MSDEHIEAIDLNAGQICPSPSIGKLTQLRDTLDRNDVQSLVRFRASREVAQTLSAALFEAGQHLLNMQRLLPREFGNELIEAKRTADSTALVACIMEAAFSEDACEGYIADCLPKCVADNAEDLLAREHEIVLERSRRDLVRLLMHLAGTNVG